MDVGLRLVPEYGPGLGLGLVLDWDCSRAGNGVKAGTNFLNLSRAGARAKARVEFYLKLTLVQV